METITKRNYWLAPSLLLKKIYSSRIINKEDLIQRVLKYYNLTFEEFLNANSSEEMTHIRRILAYMLYTRYRLTFDKLKNILKTNINNVQYWVKTYNIYIESDKEFKSNVDKLMLDIGYNIQ